MIGVSSADRKREAALEIHAATACSTANNGSYATCDEDALIADFGWNQSADVNSVVEVTGDTQWVATSTHAVEGTTYTFDSDDGTITGPDAPAPA